MCKRHLSAVTTHTLVTFSQEAALMIDKLEASLAASARNYDRKQSELMDACQKLAAAKEDIERLKAEWNLSVSEANAVAERCVAEAVTLRSSRDRLQEGLRESLDFINDGFPSNEEEFAAWFGKLAALLKEDEVNETRTQQS